MSSKEFYFSLTVPAAQVSAPLLRDLVSRVCALCTCTEPAATVELTRQLAAAVEQAAGHGDCELRFSASAGALDVAVRAGARQVWQVSRPID